MEASDNFPGQAELPIIRRKVPNPNKVQKLARKKMPGI
jgi:hypothetical protein